MKKIEKEIRKYKVYCEESLQEYLDLIKVPDTEKDLVDGSSHLEIHHILPRSMYPELLTEEWNLVRMTRKRHEYAHELLMYIFNNNPTKRAFTLMNSDNSRVYAMERALGAYSGDANPARRKCVRKKISEAKTGVERPDMKGKRYMGADEETIAMISKKISERVTGTVIVRDKEGNRFRVDNDDPRYLSGELIPFNRGVKMKNPSLSTPELVNQVLTKRSKTYEKFNGMSEDEIVNFLIESHNNNKNIFSSGKYKGRYFSKNYSGYVKRTGHDQSLIYEMVIQRLSKASEESE